MVRESAAAADPTYQTLKGNARYAAERIQAEAVRNETRLAELRRRRRGPHRPFPGLLPQPPQTATRTRWRRAARRAKNHEVASAGRGFRLRVHFVPQRSHGA